jgi:hypothetical protein
MAKRPIQQKQRRRVAKLLRRRSPEGFLDLVQWLKDRKYAQTTGEAEKIILAKRVKADSHPLGVEKRPMLQPDLSIAEVDVVVRHIPAAYRGHITVTP